MIKILIFHQDHVHRVTCRISRWRVPFFPWSQGEAEGGAEMASLSEEMVGEIKEAWVSW
jgi:hypothetical protein